jgi:stearoyl-CoA desaturase (delta-9 desaturase)
MSANATTDIGTQLDSLAGAASIDFDHGTAAGAKSDTSILDDKAAWQAERERRTRHGLDWPTVVWLAVVHAGVIAAPFVFTWQGLALMFALHWLTGGIGICLGFHRLFTHGSFQTYRPVRWLIATIGGLAGEGSCIHWVANHRKHHALSDRVGDPHSPHDGPWWSHALWCWYRTPPKENEAYHRRWTPDLADERYLVFLDRTFILWHLMAAAVLFGIGYASSGTFMAWSLVVWGMFVRLVFVLHSTWFVNSASHMWGYRNYDTTDDSRNNWWVALITYGEGWHNNHHAYPRMARHGHRWWEVDLTFWTIRGLEKLGLAWNVVDGQHRRREGVGA